MDKTRDYLEAITVHYPELQIRNARLHNENGQFNDILIVNDEIIFRFPRYAEGIQRIRNEVLILGRIRSLTTLPIPDPIYTNGDEQRLGKVFMGYAKIPGEPLWRETLRSIRDHEVLQRLADSLARFLKELHRIPVESLGKDLPVHDSFAETSRLYAGIRTHLFHFMRPDARSGVIDQFERYLAAPHLHHYPVALHHGDFGGSNILYDRESQTIRGIIDFGFAGLGDPALDIASVSTFGDAFLARFYAIYPEIESMVERANFYKATFALEEALHGVMTGDEQAFKAGIAQYI